jgi:hypothetical protein
MFEFRMTSGSDISGPRSAERERQWAPGSDGPVGKRACVNGVVTPGNPPGPVRRLPGVGQTLGPGPGSSPTTSEHELPGIDHLARSRMS